jgi:hypothetical protein
VQANNVEVIVERMMGYLRSSTPDEHIRRDIVRKVCDLNLGAGCGFLS